MNHGHWMRVLLPLTAAVAIDKGTIQSARASFTVVPTANATAPYLAEAPTTELVSWIAKAAHNPNWVCERFNQRPIMGNVSSATEFNTKIVPSETDISSSVCLLYTSPSPRDGLLSRMPS